nr:hypothetical protein Iba_chr14cCG2560 [Ipomoea batatas]
MLLLCAFVLARTTLSHLASRHQTRNTGDRLPLTGQQESSLVPNLILTLCRRYLDPLTISLYKCAIEISA